MIGIGGNPYGFYTTHIKSCRWGQGKVTACPQSLKMPFRCDRVHYFITWDHLIATPQEILFALRNHCPFAQASPFKASIACEYGDNGNDEHDGHHFHAHASISFARKRTCRNPRAFDILGKHGRIEPTRDVHDAHVYIHKEEGTDPSHWTGCGDGDSVCHLCEGAPGEEAEGGRMDWGALLDMATSRGEYLRLVQLHFPQYFQQRLRDIHYFVDHFFPAVVPQEQLHYERSDFKEPMELLDWVNGNLVGMLGMSPRESPRRDLSWGLSRDPAFFITSLLGCWVANLFC